MLGDLVKEQCSVFEGIFKRNVECFQHYHNCIMKSQICFRNRSLFNELQFVCKRLCKICDFRLPVR